MYCSWENGAKCEFLAAGAVVLGEEAGKCQTDAATASGRFLQLTKHC